MLQNLAYRVGEVWRDYRYPPKHREFVDEWRLITGYEKRSDINPETTIRQLKSLANKQNTKYKRGMYVGAGLMLAGLVTLLGEPLITNEIRNVSEYLAQISSSTAKPIGAIISTAGLTHFIRNLSLLSEISDYLREA